MNCLKARSFLAKEPVWNIAVSYAETDFLRNSHIPGSGDERSMWHYHIHIPFL